MSIISFSQYFSTVQNKNASIDQNLADEFHFCNNGNIIFHWADYHETCEQIKKTLQNNTQLKEDFDRKQSGINSLNLIPVWIRTHAKVVQTTMHSLYERYVFNETSILDVDPFGPIDISFISGTGPFKQMAITECFNRSTYRDFIFIYLLKNKLPRRDFRLRLKAKILLEYGNELSNAHLVNVEQILEDGILFSVDSDVYLKNISKSPRLRFLIDTSMLKEASQRPIHEMKAYLSQYAFNFLYSSKKSDSLECNVADMTVQSGFDFFQTKKMYLYLNFKSLSKDYQKVAKNVQDFMLHSKAIVKNHYHEVCSNIKSA